MKHFTDIGQAVLRLIPERFSSDAAFERAANLAPKTVSNWRRGRSATYMKMLPRLELLLGEEFSAYLHETPASGSGLSREEERLLRAWRATEELPPEARKSLLTTVLNIMKLPVGGKTK